MLRVERTLYRDSRLVGVTYTASGVALGAAAGLILDRLLGRRLACVVAASLSIAGRMLDTEAQRIGEQLQGNDLQQARVAVRSLVGRRSDTLTAEEITRATIESVAENTVDAVTAPMMWAAIGGAPAVLAYRAINTMDAMVGHHTERYERFGWASARLDDLVNWLPARLTSALTIVPMNDRRSVWRSVVDQARSHPSPNGGTIEGAFAHRLGIRLGGINRYDGRVEDRGLLGAGDPPSSADIARATALRRQVSALSASAMLAIELTGAVRSRRRAAPSSHGRQVSAAW